MISLERLRRTMQRSACLPVGALFVMFAIALATTPLYVVHAHPGELRHDHDALDAATDAAHDRAHALEHEHRHGDPSPADTPSQEDGVLATHVHAAASITVAPGELKTPRLAAAAPESWPGAPPWLVPFRAATHPPYRPPIA